MCHFRMARETLHTESKKDKKDDYSKTWNDWIVVYKGYGS